MYKHNPTRKVAVTNIAPVETVSKGPPASEERDLNIDRLKAAIKLLISEHKRPVFSLDRAGPEVQDSFVLVRDYVRLLYDRPEIFSLISEEVKHGIAGLSKEKVLPGTIGAYLKGFTVKTDIPGGRSPCANVSAGAFPLDGKGKQEFCSDKVLSMFEHDGRLVLTWQYTDAKSKRVILHVPFSSYAAFPGLSDQEIKELKKYGVEQIEVLGEGFYKGDTFVQKSLTNGFIQIENLKIRHEKKEQHSPSNGYGVIFFIGFLVIAAILLLIVLRRW